MELLKKLFEQARERPEQPLEQARAAIAAHNIPSQERTTHAVIGDIIRLHLVLTPRWGKFKEYQLWEQSGCEGLEPRFEDEETHEGRSGKYALAPCKLLNESLSEFVDLTLKVYTSKKLQSIMKVAQLNPETTHAVKELRQIAIHAEEAMEQEALGLIFKAVESNPETYKATIEAIIREKYSIAKTDPIPGTPEMRTALLEALVVDFPRKIQQAQPEEYKGMVFPYFNNYPTLVESELELLTTPFLLQNANAPYFHKNIADLLQSNPAICKAVSAISSRYCDGAEAEKAVEHFIDGYPEIFGVQKLAEKTFTFVGAGFPLTGLLQHIQTEGATINLIDCDEAAVFNARKLIAITDFLGISRKGAIGVINADARDVTYVPRKNSAPYTLRQVEYAGYKGKLEVATDILDLASALPKDVTNHVMQINADSVPIVRKRNVSGISELLYERFTLPKTSIFRLAGHVTPAQKVISGASPEHSVTGIMSPINVNSNDVYVNTSRLLEKSDFLTSLVPVEEETKSSKFSVDETPNTQVLGGGEVQWSTRTMAYYRQ